MKNVNEILERQSAYLGFGDGKVKYFSISTQHSEADTIEEAIQDILKADELFKGKSSLGYVMEKFEEEHPLPEVIDPEMCSKKNIEKLIKFFNEGLRRNFRLGVNKDFGS